MLIILYLLSREREEIEDTRYQSYTLTSIHLCQLSTRFSFQCRCPYVRTYTCTGTGTGTLNKKSGIWKLTSSFFFSLGTTTLSSSATTTTTNITILFYYPTITHHIYEYISADLQAIPIHAHAHAFILHQELMNTL